MFEIPYLGPLVRKFKSFAQISAFYILKYNSFVKNAIICKNNLDTHSNFFLGFRILKWCIYKQKTTS